MYRRSSKLDFRENLSNFAISQDKLKSQISDWSENETMRQWVIVIFEMCEKTDK